VFHVKRRTIPRLFVLALAGAGVFWPVQTLSVAYSSAASAAFLVGTYPVLVTLLSPVLLGETLHSQKVAGSIAALAGAFLVISGRGQLLGLFSSQTLLGDTLAMLTSLSFAGYMLLSKRWSPHLGLPPETVSVYTFSLALPILLLAAAFWPSGTSLSQHSPTHVAWGAVLWLGTAATAGAFLALNRGLQEAGASRSAVHLMLVPLVAALLSCLLLGERMAPAQMAGGGLIVIGILIANWRPLSHGG